MALEEFTKRTKKSKKSSTTNGKSPNRLTRQSQWGSFISVIDNSEEERRIGNGKLYMYS